MTVGSPSVDEPPTAALAAATQAFSLANGQDALAGFEHSSGLILAWLDYFEGQLSKDVCDTLLQACRSAEIEAVGCLSLGLVRPALFAIRMQFELVLAWLYFNDHPIEWQAMSRGELDFPMRRQNIAYLEKHSLKFKPRFTLLSNRGCRADKEPYRTLSSFVHGSTIAALPVTTSLHDAVQNRSAVDACNSLQHDVSEYLSDVAASWLTNRWHDFPSAIKLNISKRLTAAKLSEFCAP